MRSALFEAAPRGDYDNRTNRMEHAVRQLRGSDRLLIVDDAHKLTLPGLQCLFDFQDVARAIADKMVRRHPHVFADTNFRNLAEQNAAWEEQKAQERAAKGQHRAGVLADVPAGMPALTRAVKLTKRAARVGFDWPDLSHVMEKLREELGELEAEIAAADLDKAREELGDFLFVCANLARKLDIDPERAVRGANQKFLRRFAHIENRLAEQGRTPEDATLEEMDAFWDEARAADKVRV